MRWILALVVSLFVAVPAVAQPHPPETAAVDFGILPLAPIGGPESGCAQTGVGGPGDPCSYKIHVLTPAETVIRKGGEVSFQIHGGGHGFAIYEVSKDTTRDNLGQQLCAGDDPATIPIPGALHACNLGLGRGGNANAPRQLLDAKDNVVLVVPQNDSTFPNNRVSSAPGRLMSAIIANPAQFLNGGTTATNGEILTYRFLKAGRYLVICMNRSHFFNDWMFGFVDVVE